MVTHLCAYTICTDKKKEIASSRFRGPVEPDLWNKNVHMAGT